MASILFKGPPQYVICKTETKQIKINGVTQEYRLRLKNVTHDRTICKSRKFENVENSFFGGYCGFI